MPVWWRDYSAEPLIRTCEAQGTQPDGPASTPLLDVTNVL
jgi:hypothetical protein